MHEIVLITYALVLFVLLYYIDQSNLSQMEEEADYYADEYG